MWTGGSSGAGKNPATGKNSPPMISADNLSFLQVPSREWSIVDKSMVYGFQVSIRS